MFLAREQGSDQNRGASVGYIFTVMVKRRSTEAVSLTEPSFAYIRMQSEIMLILCTLLQCQNFEVK